MPCSPTQRVQPKVAPASIETRALISCGRTAARYVSSCSSKSSHHGIETTRAGIFCVASSFCTARARLTSEPVAIRIARGLAPAG